MTDEELCKALRSALWGQGHHINIKAADRIEALTAELAKAVEALQAAVKWADSFRWAAPWVDDAHATLAEIEGEKR